MPRLRDDVLRASQLVMPPAFAVKGRALWESRCHIVSAALEQPNVPVVVVDNVAEYYFNTPQEHWDLKVDFPNIAPPWPAFWVEYRIPERGFSEKSGELKPPKGRIGLLFTTSKPTAKDVPAAKWIVHVDMVQDLLHWGARYPVGPLGPWALPVAEDGTLCGEYTLQWAAGSTADPAVMGLAAWLHPAYLAISFCHCKNVEIKSVRPDQKLSRAYHRRHGKWLSTYHVLEIEPMKRVLSAEGQAETAGLKQALHICRGHFKDYRSGRGLFGKHPGLYWWDMAVRGTLEVGEAKKDYHIIPGSKEGSAQ